MSDSLACSSPRVSNIAPFLVPCIAPFLALYIAPLLTQYIAPFVAPSSVREACDSFQQRDSKATAMWVGWCI